MAQVFLIIDPLGLCQDWDLRVSSPEQIQGARKKIRAHLAMSSGAPLRICLDGMLFGRFKEFEGYDDVVVLRLSPRSELAKHLAANLPWWCSDELIQELELLQSPHLAEDDPEQCFPLRIMGLLNPMLVRPESIVDFLQAFKNAPAGILKLLQLKEIADHFISVLKPALGDGAAGYLFDTLRNNNYRVLIDSLFREVPLERLRKLASELDLSCSLPPRQFPLEITASLPICQDPAVLLPVEGDLIAITKLIIHRIKLDQLPADSLAKAIVFASAPQLQLLEQSITQAPTLATKALLQSLTTLDSAACQGVMQLVADSLELAPPGALAPNSSASAAMQWAGDYLKYAFRLFQRGAEPAADVCHSFSAWADSQPSRLQNAEFNWRYIGSSVRTALLENKTVLLIVIDAFGAVVCDRLLAALREIPEPLVIDHKNLFAPLPTLTEIGKLAVATGKDTFKLPSDQLSAIQAAYANEISDCGHIKFIKSWAPGENCLEQGTRLLVYFENQLDDQLHECLDFDAFQKQLDIVVEKVANFVAQRLAESKWLGKDLRIFITADHGMTFIEQLRQPSYEISGASTGERAIKMPEGAHSAPPGYFLVKPEGAGKLAYLVPKDRVRLRQSAPFVHGGLTPEEVLIPAVSIQLRSDESAATVRLEAVETTAKRSASGWEVKLRVTAGEDSLHAIKVGVLTPFAGEADIPTLPSKASQDLSFYLSSAVNQEGLVPVHFTVKCFPASTGKVETIDCPISIQLPAQLLVRDTAVQDFDDMFD